MGQTSTPRPRSALRPYQIGAIEFVKRVKRCALFVDPGLGKTSSALTAITDLIENLDCGRTLVIAPPRVTKKTWPDELRTWAHLKDVSYVVIDGSPKKRMELLKRPACFHMVSIENLPWLLTALGGRSPVRERVDKETGDVLQEAIAGWKSPKRSPYSAIIVDESSKVKASSTNRWKALNKLAFVPGVEYFIELTGTPAPNNMHDLWAQIYLLDRGERLGSSLTTFRDRWFEASYDGHGYGMKGDYVIKSIQDRIADIVFTLREEDYANLPPRMYNDIVLPMEDKLKEKYKHLEKKYVIESIAGDKTIKAMAGASVMNKLQQLCNGTVYDEEKGEHEFHNLKLDALRGLVEETGGAPLLVAYTFKSDLRRIMKAFPEAKRFDDNPETQDSWNRGEIPMLLVHPQSAAHGLNLQFGGNVVVWYGLTWSLELYIQLNKRLHRSGQKKPVMVHHLVVEGTVDEKMLDSLEGKNTNQDSLLNALKELIEKYANG